MSQLPKAKKPVPAARKGKTVSKQRDDDATFKQGRGAQLNPQSRFGDRTQVAAYVEAIDEPTDPNPETQFFIEHPREIVNRIDSPDLRNMYSLNPYQGCEHGCIYCYARNVHEYWGYSAGTDFEQKIIVKPNAPVLLRAFLQRKNWLPTPISLSGNTDCYQPAERKYRITRQLLEIFWEHRHPVGVITKNSLILRDLDVLQKLASENLVHVFVSITGLDESLRRLMEPRTATYARRFQVIRELSKAGIPVGVMNAPLIPGLNSHESSDVIAAAADAGALAAGYTIVRLNGAIGSIFRDWIHRHLPDRAEKVLHQIEESHGGQVNDSRFGTRMTGEGPIAESIGTMFRLAVAKHLTGRSMPTYNLNAFRSRPEQMALF